MINKFFDLYCCRSTSNIINYINIKLKQHSIHTTILNNITPKNLKGKSKSSQEWIIRQLKDPYVKKAKEMNYRARSAFKLIEIDNKYKILKPGMNIIECGARPGAWSQVTINKINSNKNDPTKSIGKLIGIDLLEIEPLIGGIFITGDFTHDSTQKQIINILNEGGGENNNLIDLILNDMAPNACGIHGIDHERICILINYVIQFAIKYTKKGGDLLTKIWDGNDMKLIQRELLKYYKNIYLIKPNSSRLDSSEIYLLCKFFK